MGCARGGLATPTTSPFMDVVQLGHAMKGVFMSVCVPVRSMKNTAEFAELVAVSYTHLTLPTTPYV